VILPKQNEKNVKEDLNEELRRGLTIHLVSTIDEALLLALLPATRGSAARAKSHGRTRAHAALQ
jgi:ATP-dependent Lon protease